MINVLYDADKDCLEHTISKTKKLKSELHVFPYCVGGSNGKSPFNIMYDAFTSSLLEPNEELSSCYATGEPSGIDYILSEAIKIEKTISLDTYTLDNILLEKIENIPKPDVLSLDIQGAEYDILQSAPMTLENVLCVILEVEFLPMYKDQKLFGDICNLLSEHGFIFCNFLSIHKQHSPYRAPIGMRSGGYLLSADALFIKPPKYIKDEDKLLRYVKLRKLAFISIVLNMFELGMQFLEESNLLGANNYKINLNYGVFLDDIERAIKTMPDIKPPSVSEVFPTVESMNARFDVDEIISLYSRAKNLVEKHYPELVLSLWHKKLNFINFIKEFPYLFTNTPVEKVLKKHRLHEQAEIIKKNRIAHSKYISNKI